MVKNVFYSPIDWQTSHGGKMLVAHFDMGMFDLSAMQIVPIDNDEQAIINRYAAQLYQKPEHSVVWYVEWPDGEWEPRGTYSNYEDAKKDADTFWHEHTQKLSESGQASR